MGVRTIPDEKLERLPEIWNDIQTSGGGMKELGAELGCTPERARQLIIKHDLPRLRSFKEKAEIFLEELEFLHSQGQGVAAIAAALRMSPESLVEKVDRLWYTGKTKVVFWDYHRRYETEEAA